MMRFSFDVWPVLHQHVRRVAFHKQKSCLYISHIFPVGNCVPALTVSLSLSFNVTLLLTKSTLVTLAVPQARVNGRR